MSTVASRPLVLVGMMGTGKTSVGRVLASRLAARFVDLDEEVERRAGRRVADIFSEQGEEAFRTLESTALADVLADVSSNTDKNLVLSTGGGVVTRPHNRELLADRRLDVVLLETSIDELLGRLPTDDARPLLGDDRRAALQALWSAREDLYRGVAKVTVSTTGSNIDEVAQSVLRELRVAV
ncbi:MAG: shikimate kinase [Ilumatobacteraceae bacterium]